MASVPSELSPRTAPRKRWLFVAAVLLCLPMGVSRAAAPVPPINVVLVHGIFDRGSIFGPMVRTLEKQGCRCLAPSLTPNDCSRGVHARFGRSSPVFLIGFSMGGLVARDYVQNVAGRGRVRGVFLISPPNHGTLWASLGFGEVRQLGLSSAFIQALNRDERPWQRTPVRTYWTPCDLMIVPATSSLWPVGDTREIFCLVHPWMVRNPALTADITARIAALTVAQQRARGAAGRCEPGSLGRKGFPTPPAAPSRAAR